MGDIFLTHFGPVTWQTRREAYGSMCKAYYRDVVIHTGRANKQQTSMA